ncbi:tyrosine-type recombinase/integrase [Pandoraea anapnoica]|uniref:tyrosine-type recombinase/integrase n=1 Tax=Pandoraea anapnoica TaxID=2508301 RepID=UPI001FEAA225|nr:tyrosine-type recombinase/integrase [Pandoraea anapnoica]
MFYYYDAGGKPRREIPLGPDFVQAVRKWTEFEADAKPLHRKLITFRYVAERYEREVLPTKALKTREVDRAMLAKLYAFFDDPPAPLNEIKPINVRQYLDWRVRSTVDAIRASGKEAKGTEGQVRANREKALFSHIWNKAREWGYTDQPNPCAGIKGYKERPRDVYIEDDEYRLIHLHARQPLRDAMDLAYLTGQRPSDVLKMSECDISDGCLIIQQGKTNAKVRIRITGQLKVTLDRISKQKIGHNPRSLYLVVNERGQRIGLKSIQSMFVEARGQAGLANPKKYQFRDLRAKAGTDKADDVGDIRAAQKQLGHTNIATTERYMRNRRGAEVEPTR